jgi:hypothetical protein
MTFCGLRWLRGRWRHEASGVRQDGGGLPVQALLPCCGGGLRGMTDPVSGSIRVGTYALEVGTLTESYAAFQPEREHQNVIALRDALAEKAGEVRTPVAALEKLQANAETVTRKCERAQELSRAASEGRWLEADAVMAEVDSLLRLAERLDRDGRFSEELRLLRALHGLLVLVRRWLDLIRALRRALTAAEETSDLAAQAWARHELGSLQLCADDPDAAQEQLGQALRLQQRLGQTTGACATRHNLDSAQRDLATRAASKPWLRRRLLRLAAVASILTLLAVGGTGMALAMGDDSGSLTTRETADTSTTSTATSTTGTSEPTTSTTVSTTTEPTTSTTIDTTTSTESEPTTSTTIDTTKPDLTLACDSPFDPQFLTVKCRLTSTEAGTAILKLRSIPFDGEKSTSHVAEPASVELKAEIQLTFVMTLPEFNARAFFVIANQTDAAGNTGTSEEVETIHPGFVD